MVCVVWSVRKIFRWSRGGVSSCKRTLWAQSWKKSRIEEITGHENLFPKFNYNTYHSYSYLTKMARQLLLRPFTYPKKMQGHKYSNSQPYFSEKFKGLFATYTFSKKSLTVLPFDASVPDRFFPFLLKPSFSSLKIGLAIWSSMTNSVGESSQWEWALMGSLQVVAKGLGSETLGY